MNLRKEWSDNDSNDVLDRFYSREETVDNVKENFDIRRLYSDEGYDIEINGVTERCLVQTSSNPLRELNDVRKIHCPITADVKRGYYVNYEGTVWIIDTNVADIDGAYLSARMCRCQYLLRWQNNEGKIVERWSYSSDQTKYSNGETGNSVITLGDNQYALLLPIDEETKLLKRNMRFAVDFEDAEEPDIYRLTNRKVNLNNELYFDRGGTMSVTLTFSEFNKDTDKQVVLDDGRKVWICDYKEPSAPTTPTPSEPDKTTDLRATITGKTDLKVGYERTYTVVFTDKETGEAVDWNDVEFTWNVDAAFDVEQFVNYNQITLSVSDEDLIGSSFILQCLVDDIAVGQIEVNIVEGW